MSHWLVDHNLTRPLIGQYYRELLARERSQESITTESLDIKTNFKWVIILTLLWLYLHLMFAGTCWVSLRSWRRRGRRCVATWAGRICSLLQKHYHCHCVQIIIITITIIINIIITVSRLSLSSSLCPGCTRQWLSSTTRWSWRCRSSPRRTPASRRPMAPTRRTPG